jgi:hypothetical protein
VHATNPTVHDLCAGKRRRHQPASAYTSIRGSSTLITSGIIRTGLCGNLRSLTMVPTGILSGGRRGKLGKSCNGRAHSLAGHAQRGRCLCWHFADGHQSSATAAFRCVRSMLRLSSDDAANATPFVVFSRRFQLEYQEVREGWKAKQTVTVESSVCGKIPRPRNY